MNFIPDEDSSLRKAPFEEDRPLFEKLIREQHLSDIELADYFNVTKDTIWSRRLLWNIPSGSQLKEEALRDNIINLWKNGYSVSELAEVLGLTLQTAYTKMRIYNVKDYARMGVEAPTTSLTNLRETLTQVDDTVVLLTYKRQPKWAVVPIEDYQDLINGVYNNLRNQNES